MVEDRLDDGTRIAQLVASEVTGNRDTLGDHVVVDADPAVEPTAAGAFAYRVVRVGDDDALTTDDRGRPTLDGETTDAVAAETTEMATVFVHPERARIDFARAGEATKKAAEASKLSVQESAGAQQQTTVFVEDGAEAKRVLTVFAAAATA